jgi:arylamine N-acetyltransferase
MSADSIESAGLASRAARSAAGPTLAPAQLERVLDRLGLTTGAPTLDLAGLTAVFAAFSEGVPFDNVQKRISYTRDPRARFPLGEPSAFFEAWLTHGTGGTCWPINGALCAMLQTLGFRARRVTASIQVPGFPPEWLPANHGTVLVTLAPEGDSGGEYLVDGWMAAFDPLPLRADAATATRQPLHRVSARPAGTTWELALMPAHKRETVTVMLEDTHDPSTHMDFLARYERTRELAFFNHALYATRRRPDGMITVGRDHVVRVDADGTSAMTLVDAPGRRRVLIEELGLSETVVDMLPADVQEVSVAL